MLLLMVHSNDFGSGNVMGRTQTAALGSRLKLGRGTITLVML
jgi:hypothetical protein